MPSTTPQRSDFLLRHRLEPLINDGLRDLSILLQISGLVFLSGIDLDVSFRAAVSHFPTGKYPFFLD